jgi:hypothetical protein
MKTKVLGCDSSKRVLEASEFNPSTTTKYGWGGKEPGKGIYESQMM